MMKYIKEDARIYNDRSLAWLGSYLLHPLCYGITNVYGSPLVIGTADQMDFMWKIFREEKINSGFFIHYSMEDILSTAQQYDVLGNFHLDWAMTGGQLCDEHTLKRFKKYVDHIIIIYGTTETPRLAMSIKDDPFDTIVKYAGAVETGIEMKVIGKDGHVVLMEEEGEIVIRSPLAFTGYLHAESVGMKITKEGWIHTGDMGYLTPQGYVKVLGRKGQRIKRGTRMIYPIQVEKMMMKFPGVEMVAVVAVPDRRLGQNICAFVIPTEGVMLTKDAMLQCFDDVYKTDEGLGVTPAYFVFVDSFPRTSSGKVDLAALRLEAMEHVDFEK